MKISVPEREPDWQDTHEGPCRADITTARQAYEAAMKNMPGWTSAAMAIRNRVVAPFGLTTKIDADQQSGENQKPMAMMLILPVIHESDDRYEVGLTDKHLTFTLDTKLENGKVSMTTSIWYNHWSGRAYLAGVYVPHKLIVGSALKSLAPTAI